MAVAASTIDYTIYGPSHNQAQFEMAARVAIDGGKDFLAHPDIRAAPAKEIFDALLEILSTARGDVAKAHKSIDAEAFGADRLKHSFLSPTPLVGPRYGPYGERVLDRMMSVLQSMKKDCSSQRKCRGFKKKVSQRDGLSCDLKTRIQTTVYNGLPGLLELSSQDPEAVRKRCLEARVAFPEEADGTPEDYLAFKKALPADYKKLIYGQVLGIYEECFPVAADSARTFYVIETHRLEIDGDLIGLTNYITAGGCKGRESLKNVIDRMRSESRVIAVHQDRFLIERTMNKAAEMFELALNWDHSKDQAELIQSLGMLRYLMAHAMPYVRGSAAITEWMEAVICEHHGFSVLSPREGDLEALTLDGAEAFMEFYRSTVALM